MDIESYSSVELSDAGVYAYTESPDFEVLLLGYKWNDEPDVHVVDLTLTRLPDPEQTLEVLEALSDPNVLKTAWNAAFERTCLAKALDRPMPPEQWDDTMVRALELGLPGSLAGAGIALGLPEEKLKDPRGKALINYFSKPCKPTKSNSGRTRNLPAHDPDKWKLYIEYNRQDVVTEQAIREMLLKKVQPIESEQRLWCIDQRINDFGVRIDTHMADNIVRYDAQHRIDLQKEAQDITGLGNPNSLVQLKGWLEKRGFPMETVTKDSMEAMLKQNLPADVRRVLEIRQALGKTSVAKYSAMLDAVCADERVRGTLQFYGAARTGRWAGRIVQTHNLARNSIEDLDLARQLVCSGDFDDLELLYGEPAFVFSELVRTAFIPSEGHQFIVADFSAIEARVISWIAEEEWRLEAFRSGKDIYCETASRMYHVPVVKHGENGHLRQKGKVAELACGYGGGIGAMKRMDRSGSIPDEELQSVVNQWRDANPRIVKLWRNCEKAARMAIEDHRNSSRPVRLRHGAIAYYYEDGNLYAKLPNGRSICYWDAGIRQDPVTGKDAIVFKSLNTARQWTDEETYSGKLVENLTQAIARDCLAETIKRVTAMGYRIVMHVHDEIIVDAPKSDTGAFERILNAMKERIPWAADLPLNADGYTCDYYRKD